MKSCNHHLLSLLVPVRESDSTGSCWASQEFKGTCLRRPDSFHGWIEDVAKNRYGIAHTAYMDAAIKKIARHPPSIP